MTIEALEEKLNLFSKYILEFIFQDYGQSMVSEDQQMLEDLMINDNVIVESDSSKYIKEKKKANEDDSIPLAHGGRVFGDEKIHFYPFLLAGKTEEEITNSCKEVLIHEMFHYFIRPGYVEEDETHSGINEYITEGLVDMIARDFSFRHEKQGLSYKKGSNYGLNVMFVRRMMSELDDSNDKTYIIFNSNIKDMLEYSSKNGNNYFDIYEKEIKDKSGYEKLIDEISSKYGTSSSSIKRKLINFGANFTNEGEALLNIKDLVGKNSSKKNASESNVLIDDYLGGLNQDIQEYIKL